jgi:hypothetical protein
LRRNEHGRYHHASLETTRWREAIEHRHERSIAVCRPELWVRWCPEPRALGVLTSQAPSASIRVTASPVINGLLVANSGQDRRRRRAVSWRGSFIILFAWISRHRHRCRSRASSVLSESNTGIERLHLCN